MSSFPKKNASRSSELPVVGSPWKKMFSFSSIPSHCKFVFVISASLIGTSTYINIYMISWQPSSRTLGQIPVEGTDSGSEISTRSESCSGDRQVLCPESNHNWLCLSSYAAPVVKICSCLGLFLEAYPFKSIMVKGFNCTLVRKRFRQPEFSYLQATWTVALGLSAELWALSSYSKGPKWKC